MGVCVPALAATAADLAPSPGAQQARDWQRLRVLKGHFDGAPWRDEVDRWNGPKHQTMQALADHLVRQSAKPQDAMRVLGPPDVRLRPGTPGHVAAATSLVGGLGATEPMHAVALRADLWLYRWRGTHDQLVLLVIAGRVQAAAWLHAGE